MANTDDTKDHRKKVLIVGAGAAGMSCAAHLAAHPDRYAITLVDASPHCGGQAFSIPLPSPSTHGAPWLNQGVQGGSPIFHHTLTAFARQSLPANPVTLHVSFGHGDQFWTNVFPTRLLARHQDECARFTWMLRIVRALEPLFALVPIRLLMKLFRFSDEFATAVALPMVALFLGTGNFATEVPSMVLERLCTSPTYGMWYPPEKESVAANQPPMVVFPNLSEFYGRWQGDLEGRGVVVRLGTEVTRIVKRDKKGVIVKTVRRKEGVEGGHAKASAWAAEGRGSEADAGAEEVEERYDELVMCCLADTSKRLLGETASWREKRVLGAAKFSDDITITHSDAAYMRKHYENFYNEEQAVDSLSGVDQTARCEAAKKSFKPMYYIKQYEQDRTKLEMCFDCTNYQAQFPPDVDFDDHVFQTIFLNKDRDGHLWTDNEIDESKVIRKDWWHQLCHSWTHYVLVVLWLWLLQGRRHTRFASSWTLVNAHEIAIMSGIAAAVDLGASYPEDLERDRWALLCFRLYYLLVYGKWYRKKAPAKGEGEDWATGLYGSVYKGPGLAEEERLMWKEEMKKGSSLQGERED